MNNALIRAVRASRIARVKARNPRASLSYGHKFALAPDATIAPGVHLTAMDRVSIGPHFVAFAHIKIGDDVMISANVGIIGDDHPFDESPKRITDFKANPLACVEIEGDSLIGFGATLMGNVTVGAGAIVGANSLILNDVPRNSIVAGSPAHVIGYRR